mgnify:FL=1
MNVDRACEILQSEKVYDVYHQGIPVWIESVDVKKGVACVNERENGENQKLVPVEELTE